VAHGIGREEPARGGHPCGPGAEESLSGAPQPLGAARQVKLYGHNLADAAVVAGYVKPGQSISAHIHPDGQDTWTIRSSCGEYRASANGVSIAITNGDVLVAHRGEVHGVLSTGQEPLVFISVVSPASSGFEPV
jgi:quercetin dioxygenase-like cupin family protein